MTSVMRPDRYELALASQVPHIQTEHPDTSAGAVTLVHPIQSKVTNGRDIHIKLVRYIVLRYDRNTGQPSWQDCCKVKHLKCISV